MKDNVSLRPVPSKRVYVSRKAFTLYIEHLDEDHEFVPFGLELERLNVLKIR